MWKPSERIRHQLPDGGWPTADEAARALLFRPLAHRALRLSSRTWVPAMVPWRATGDGFVNSDVLAWYERLARGRPGALVVEATGIREVPSGPLLRIGDDRFVPGLFELVETVRRASGGETRLLLQILDFLLIRRRPTPERFFRRYLELTDRHRAAVPGCRSDEEVREALLALPSAELAAVLDDRELESLSRGFRQRVTDLHDTTVRELPKVLPGLFAAAAGRALRAGFDGVELHYAHAYTMASFLSARNIRNDGYGGDRVGRVRLPLEVLRAVRGQVGRDFVVGVRLLADECIVDGSGVDDAAWFAVQLAEEGIDILSLSRGGKFEDAEQPSIGWAAYPYTGPSGYECMPTAISDDQGPFGRNVGAGSSIRRALRSAGHATPVVVAGGICSFTQAEELLRRGDADVIAAARQTLADPDWFAKMRLGRGGEIRRCIYSNYCEGLDQKHKQVTCQLWDRADLDESGAPLSHDGRRRLVAPAWRPPEDPAGGS